MPLRCRAVCGEIRAGVADAWNESWLGQLEQWAAHPPAAWLWHRPQHCRSEPITRAALLPACGLDCPTLLMVREERVALRRGKGSHVAYVC